MIEWFSDREDKDRMFTSLPLTCSFSEKCDLLSQWRGYGDDGRGISIGFNQSELKRIFNPFDLTRSIINFKKIIYKETEQVQFISEDIETFFRDIELSFSEPSPDICEDKIMKAIMKLLFGLLLKSPECKNQFFEEEKEWRIFINFPNDLENEDRAKTFKEILTRPMTSEIFTPLSMYTRGKKLVHFVDFKWGKLVPEIIKEIWVGPKAQISINDVRSFLDTQGIKNHTEIRIEVSKGSYR